MDSSFLTLPTLPEKPRGAAINAAIDGGLGLTAFRDAVELNAPHLDFVKFGWGSSLITSTLAEKIHILESNDVKFWIGGTSFEIAWIQDKLDLFVDWVENTGATFFEISDGAIEITLDKKLELIEKLSGRFNILSEIGSKDIEKVMTPREWVRRIRAEKAAGAWKIIAEGRESGTVGIYRSTGEIREGLVEEIREAGISLDDIIFEAPQKSQQVWLIKWLSERANFGNIPLEQVLNVQALRLGLRADTIHLHQSK